MEGVPTPPDRRVYTALERLAIAFERFEHPPVATVEQALQYWTVIDAVHAKNLFLRNKKGTRHYLVVAERSCSVDLRALAGDMGDDRLSFGSAERLMNFLGVEPGSVSPFGLLNDPHHHVTPVIDANLSNADFVAFHPNVNTVTLRLTGGGFRRFLESTGHVVRWMRL